MLMKICYRLFDKSFYNHIEIYHVTIRWYDILQAFF